MENVAPLAGGSSLEGEIVEKSVHIDIAEMESASLGEDRRTRAIVDVVRTGVAGRVSVDVESVVFTSPSYSYSPRPSQDADAVAFKWPSCSYVPRPSSDSDLVAYTSPFYLDGPLLINGVLQKVSRDMERSRWRQS